MDNSAYEMGRAVGTVIGSLLCVGVTFLAVVAIILAFVKRTTGWIVSAVIFVLIGLAGGVVGGVFAFRGIKTAIKEQSDRKTVVSKDGAVSLSVPASWRELSELHADATIAVGNKFAEEYAVVLSDLRTDFTGTFEEFGQITTTRMRDNLQGGTISEPRPLTINGFRAIRRTIEGTADKTRVCYLHTSIETPESYHQVLQWTLPSKKARAFPIFEQVDVTFTVVKPERPAAPAAQRSGSVEDRVRAILVEQLAVKPEDVGPQTRLTTDLGADDLDVVEIVMALEEEFGLEIPDEEAEKFNRVGDIVNWINRKKRQETL